MGVWLAWLSRQPNAGHLRPPRGVWRRRASTRPLPSACDPLKRDLPLSHSILPTTPPDPASYSCIHRGNLIDQQNKELSLIPL